MDMLWRRKSALFTLLFVYTGFVSPFLSVKFCLTAALAAVVLFAVSFVPPLQKEIRCRVSLHLPAVFRLILCAVLLSLLFFSVCRYVTVDRPAEKLIGTETEITAIIRDSAYTSAASAAYTADITTDSGVTCRVLLQLPESGLAAGDKVSCTAVFSPFQEYNGSFPEQRYYYSLRTALRAEADNMRYLGCVPVDFLRERFSRLQDSLSGILRAELGRAGSALANALFLGDRSDLADTLTRDFRRLGISHLLAISGMHFTLLLFGLDKILQTFLKNKKIRTGILAAADVGYMFLCGLSPSVVRAGLMMLLVYAALFFGRKSDTPTSLGFASFLMCLADPAAIYSVGLQLSVTAVLALCVFSHITRTLFPEKPSSRKSHLLQNTAAVLLLPMAVQLALLPLLCLYFGEVSLITPIAAVLFTPLIELILLLTPLYLLLRFALIGAAITWLSDCTAQVTGAMASLRGITLSLSYSFAPLYAFTLSGLFLSAPLCHQKKALRRHLAAILGICALFAASVGITRISTADEVTVLSAAKGKNDAVIVMTAGETLLMDISDGSYGALSDAYAAAAKQGAVELEGLYLTHLHKQHIQSVQRLTDTVYVRSLFLPLPETDTEAEVHPVLCTLAESKNIPVHTYSPTDRLSWGDNVEILPEARLYLPRSSHPLITFTLRANGTDFTYLGAAASEIAAFGDQSDTHVLVFGMHGPLYKTAIDVSVSDCLRTAVCRGESPTYLSDDLKNALSQTTVYTDSEVVPFILSP